MQSANSIAAIQLLELVPGGHKELAFAKQRSAELKATW